MKAVFADTAFFLALVNARDLLHPQAVALNAHPPGPMLITEWVLMELGDALAIPSGRTRFVRLVAALRAQSDVQIVSASPDLFARAFTLYAQRLEKAWSLTDCTSFVAMQDHTLTAAVTAAQAAGVRPIGVRSGPAAAMRRSLPLDCRNAAKGPGSRPPRTRFSIFQSTIGLAPSDRPPVSLQ